MNDAPDILGNYMKRINIHDVEVSISAWVSHVMPLNPFSRQGYSHRKIERLLA